VDELAWLARKYQHPPENYVYSAFCGKMNKDVPNLAGKVKEVLGVVQSLKGVIVDDAS